MTDKILICTDLDRTLIPNGHPPESPQARPLLRRLVTRDNIYLAYVSGRDKNLLEEAIKEWGLPTPDYAIGDVGTSVYKIDSGHWQQIDDWHEKIGHDWGKHTRSDIASLLTGIETLTLQEAHKQNNYKLSYYVPEDIDLSQLLKNIAHNLESAGIRYNAIWSIDELKQLGLLDILPQSANKLEAIRFLMQNQGFRREDTVFSGDSGNDLEVLCSDIQSTLVNNATDNIKDQAQQIAMDNGNKDQLYIAKGNFLGMNGNYAAGILEGLAHYIPQTYNWMIESSHSF